MMISIEKKYQDALDYLYSFIDYSLTRNLRYSPEKFNLARMVSFLEKLNNPQDNYPSIHVAGTKGKGSVCAFISTILQEAGYSVGFYSSPHMHEFTERIRVNSRQIPKIQFVEIIDQMKPVIAQAKELTTFEITTALAFLYFAKSQVDIAVIEVGLGGRLDATNVINPLVAAITSISLDHTKILGNTVEKIAREKAGIIKPGIPTVLAPQKENVKAVIREIADTKNSRLIEIGNDVIAERLVGGLGGEKFYFSKTASSNKGLELTIPLLGSHQVENAAVAFAVIEYLISVGYKINDKYIKNGFRNTKWPGRFEILSRNPYVIIDSSHNVDAIRKLDLTLYDYFPLSKVTLIFGASEDKQITKMLRTIQPNVEKIIFTRAKHPRAVDPLELSKKLDCSQTPFVIADSPEIALTEALDGIEVKDSDQEVILATGSIFLAAAIKDVWTAMKKRKENGKKSK